MQIARKQHYIYRGKTMNNTFEIGKKLVDLCKQGKDLEAIETLDSPNIVSVEAVADQGFTSAWMASPPSGVSSNGGSKTTRSTALKSKDLFPMATVSSCTSSMTSHQKMAQ